MVWLSGSAGTTPQWRGHAPQACLARGPRSGQESNWREAAVTTPLPPLSPGSIVWAEGREAGFGVSATFL